MPLIQLAVAGHVVVDDPAVKGRSDTDCAAVVQGRHIEVESAQMGIMHGSDAAAGDTGDSSSNVLGYDGSRHDPFLHIQMVFIAENFHLQRADEIGLSNGQFNQRPVGAIDEIVVVDSLSTHHSSQLFKSGSNLFTNASLPLIA